MFKSGQSGQRLADLQTAYEDSVVRYNTQEIVWGTTGLAKYINAGGDDYKPAVLLADGKQLRPSNVTKSENSERIWHVARASEYETLSLRLNDKGKAPVYLMLNTEGIKKDAVYEFGGQGLALKRTFHNANGKELNLTDGSAAFGKVVYIKIAVTNKTNEPIHNIALVDRIPSGWEIENPRLGRSQATSWFSMRSKWNTDYMNIRDDRIELFGKLKAKETRFGFTRYVL